MEKNKELNLDEYINKHMKYYVRSGFCGAKVERTRTKEEVLEYFEEQAESIHNKDWVSATIYFNRKNSFEKNVSYLKSLKNMAEKSDDFMTLSHSDFKLIEKYL